MPEAACVLSWDSIERELGDDAWIVSRKNAGIRIAGYLEAARRGADVIATIDDDCYPAGDAFMQSHLDALLQTPRWVTSAMNMTARGVPYRNRGQLQIPSTSTPACGAPSATTTPRTAWSWARTSSSSTPWPRPGSSPAASTSRSAP